MPLEEKIYFEFWIDTLQSAIDGKRVLREDLQSFYTYKDKRKRMAADKLL